MLATVFVITAAGIALATFPQARFDGDPVNLKDPDAPSVKTFLELARKKPACITRRSTWLNPARKAREMAAKFKALPDC
jgi:hypothetical protein